MDALRVELMNPAGDSVGNPYVARGIRKNISGLENFTGAETGASKDDSAVRQEVRFGRRLRRLAGVERGKTNWEKCHGIDRLQTCVCL